MRSWDDFDTETPETVDEEISAPAARRSWDDFGPDDTEAKKAEEDALDAVRQRERDRAEKKALAAKHGYGVGTPEWMALVNGGQVSDYEKEPENPFGVATALSRTVGEVGSFATKAAAGLAGGVLSGPVGAYAGWKSEEARQEYVDAPIMAKAQEGVAYILDVRPEDPEYEPLTSAFLQLSALVGGEVAGGMVKAVKARNARVTADMINKMVDEQMSAAKGIADTEGALRQIGGPDAEGIVSRPRKPFEPYDIKGYEAEQAAKRQAGPRRATYEEAKASLESRTLGPVDPADVPTAAQVRAEQIRLDARAVEVAAEINPTAVNGPTRSASIFSTADEPGVVATKPAQGLFEAEATSSTKSSTLATKSIEIPKHLQDVIKNVDPTMPFTEVAKLAFQTQDQADRVQRAREMFATQEAPTTPSAAWNIEGKQRPGSGDAFKGEWRSMGRAARGGVGPTARQVQEREWTEWAKTVDMDLLRKTAYETLDGFMSVRKTVVPAVDKYTDPTTITEHYWDFSKATPEQMDKLKAQVVRDLSLDPGMRALLLAGDFRQEWRNDGPARKYQTTPKSAALWKKHQAAADVANEEINKLMPGHVRPPFSSDFGAMGEKVANLSRSVLATISSTQNISDDNLIRNYWQSLYRQIEYYQSRPVSRLHTIIISNLLSRLDELKRRVPAMREEIEVFEKAIPSTLTDAAKLHEWLQDLMEAEPSAVGVLDRQVWERATTLDELMLYGSIRQSTEEQEVIEPSQSTTFNIVDRMATGYSQLGSDWPLYVTTGVVSQAEFNSVWRATTRLSRTDPDAYLDNALKSPGGFAARNIKDIMDTRRAKAITVPSVTNLTKQLYKLLDKLQIPRSSLSLAMKPGAPSGHQTAVGVEYNPRVFNSADQPTLFGAVVGIHEILHYFLFSAGAQTYGARRLFANLNLAPLDPLLARVYQAFNRVIDDKRGSNHLAMRAHILSRLRSVIMMAYPGQKYDDIDLVDYAGQPYGQAMGVIALNPQQIAAGSRAPSNELAEGLRWAAEWIFSGSTRPEVEYIKSDPLIYAFASFAADQLIENGGEELKTIVEYIPQLSMDQIQEAYRERLSRRNRNWVYGKSHILSYYDHSVKPVDEMALAREDMDAEVLSNMPVETLVDEIVGPSEGVLPYGPQNPGELNQYARPLQFGLDQMRALLTEVVSVLQKNPGEVSQPGVSNTRPWSTTSMGLRPALRKVFANVKDLREARTKMAKIMGNSTLGVQERAEQAFEVLHVPLSNLTRDGLTELRSIIEPYAMKNWLLTKAKDHPALFAAHQLLDARMPVASRALQLFNEAFTTSVPRQWQKLMFRTMRDSKIKAFFETNGFLPFNERGFEKFTQKFMEQTLSPHFMAARLKEKQFLSSTKNMFVNTKSHDWIMALEWMVKNPWESMPMKGSVSPLLGNIIHYVKRELPALFTFAYQQLNYYRDSLVAFTVTEGLPRAAQLLGVKPGASADLPMPTGSQHMPRINLTREVERLAEKGLTEQWEKAASNKGLSRHSMFQPKRGAAVSPKRTIMDSKYALGRGIELAVSARFRTEAMRVVSRIPELVSEKSKQDWHPWLERGTPFSGMYVHPDVWNMFTNQELPINSWVMATRTLSLIPRTMSTIANPVGHALNRLWAISTYFSETGQLASPKAYAAWRSATDFYWDELWELHMLPYDQVPETNLLKKLELRGLTRMHLGGDPLFHGLREEYTQAISNVAGKPIPVKAWRESHPKLVGMMDWLKDHYVQHDKLAMYAIARQLIAKGVPSVEAIQRGRNAVVNLDNSPKWAQWINHLGLSNFITWKMESIPVLLRQLHRNPLTILNEMVMTFTAGALLSISMGYAPTIGKNELLAPRMKEMGQQVTAVGFMPWNKGKALSTNTFDVFNRFSILESLWRNGPDGALKMLENTPADVAAELIHNKDANGRQLYDPAMLETPSGRYYLAKFATGKALRHYSGSTLNKMRKYVLSTWNGGKDEFGNDVGFVGPLVDMVVGIKSYQIDIHQAGNDQIHYLDARIRAIKAAKTNANGNKFYQAKYGLDAEDAKILAADYDVRIKELEEQKASLRKLVK